MQHLLSVSCLGSGAGPWLWGRVLALGQGLDMHLEPQHCWAERVRVPWCPEGQQRPWPGQVPSRVVSPLCPRKKPPVQGNSLEEEPRPWFCKIFKIFSL